MLTKHNAAIADTLKSMRYEVADVFANALYLSPRWKKRLNQAKAIGKYF